MSTDSKVTKNLMQVLKDGEEGFTKAAKEMSTLGFSDSSATLERLGSERSKYYNELDKIAATYGDDLEESSSITAALHRGWMSVKEALSGSNAKAVLDAAEQGEDHSKSTYEDALKEDISTNFRPVVQRQYEGICAAHDQVKRLRDSVKDAK